MQGQNQNRNGFHRKNEIVFSVLLFYLLILWPIYGMSSTIILFWFCKILQETFLKLMAMIWRWIIFEIMWLCVVIEVVLNIVLWSDDLRNSWKIYFRICFKGIIREIGKKFVLGTGEKCLIKTKWNEHFLYERCGWIN